jgi:hypothetical protein
MEKKFRRCGPNPAQGPRHAGQASPTDGAQPMRGHAVTTASTGAVERVPRARWWWVLNEVLMGSTGKAAGWHRERWQGEGLTREGCWWLGGGRVPRRWCLSTAIELRWTPRAGFGSHSCAESWRVWGRGQLTRRKLGFGAHRGLAVGGGAPVESGTGARTLTVEAGQEVSVEGELLAWCQHKGKRSRSRERKVGRGGLDSKPREEGGVWLSTATRQVEGGGGGLRQVRRGGEGGLAGDQDLTAVGTCGTRRMQPCRAGRK